MKDMKNQYGSGISMRVFWGVLILVFFLYSAGLGIAQNMEQKYDFIAKASQQSGASEYIEKDTLISGQWWMLAGCFGVIQLLLGALYTAVLMPIRRDIAEIKAEMSMKLDREVHKDCPNFAKLFSLLNKE